MGQKPSHFTVKLNKTKLPLSLVLRTEGRTTHNPNPEQPIKFQYKTKRKEAKGVENNNKTVVLNNLNVVKSNNLNEAKCRIIKTQNAPVRTKSEPSLVADRNRERHRRKKKSARLKSGRNLEQFGYEIGDVDAFLSKATIEKPANIPVVLAFPSVLYQTRIGGYQAEIQLPLGMVVNAVFKNQHWLYVQTPHAEEGYVSYAACLPLGIIPPPDDNTSTTPCWEDTTDVFPKPSGNMTDTEKLSSKSCCSVGRCHSRRSRMANSTCSEKSFDKLYLRATASAKLRGSTTRQTLLVVCSDYESEKRNTLVVKKGDVVVLLSTQVKGWFWVRSKEGAEGFIPAAVAGHGFL